MKNIPDERVEVQNQQLQQRLHDAEQTLMAIGGGEVDALVIDTAVGKRIYTLQGADEPYRRMIEQMHEGAATLSSEGTILYSNHQLANLLQQPLKRVIGSNMTRYLGEQQSRFMQMLDDVHHGYQRQEFELQINAQLVPVQLSLSAITIDQQLRFCAVVSDLTEQRQREQLEKSESHFRQLAQAIPQIVWTTRPDGMTTDFLNDRWLQYSGISIDDNVVRCWLQIIHPEDQTHTMDHWQRAIDSGTVFEVEHRMQDHDGQYHWHLSRGIPIHDEQGRIQKWLGTSTNIESQKRAEAATMNLAKTLEQRVTERTALAEQRTMQLRQAANALVQAEQRERKRIAQTLHDDLQQLLVAAKLKVGMSCHATDRSNKAYDWLKDVDRLLHEAIEASRDLSTDLSPPILYERSLCDALRWLGERMSRQHLIAIDIEVPNAEVQLLLPEPLRDFLFQSARELLFNTVKHASGTRVVLTMTCSEHGIELTVRDDGIGSDPELMARGKTTGNGLSSIRQRTEFWGGTMDVQTAKGQGCRVRLRLPACLMQTVEPPTADQPQLRRRPQDQRLPPQRAPNKRIRVLIADDHAIVRDGLVGLLQHHGFEVAGEAEDGQQAIDLAIALQPQIVLMDISMPHVNGIDATRVISEKAPHIQVIGLSMHDDTEIATAMRNAGAVGFLTKGCPAQLLVDTIRKSAADRPIAP